MTTQLEDYLAHSRAAYLHAVDALPKLDSPRSWPIRSGKFEFSSPSQVESMLIELGWAFFCRYEGCLEAFLKANQVTLTMGTPLKRWLSDRMTIPVDKMKPLKVYRDIRNKLHHEDGASFDGDPDSEIHLLPEHMESFYEFFVWIGEQVACLSGTREVSKD